MSNDSYLQKLALGSPCQLYLRALDRDPNDKGSWVDVHYVGEDRVRGGHIIQFLDGRLHTTQAALLRVKPTPRVALIFEDSTLANKAHDIVREHMPLTTKIEWWEVS